MRYRFFLFLIIALGCTCLNAQSAVEVDTTRTSGFEFNTTVYPFVFFLPETRLGFGGASVITFRLPGEKRSSRPSSINAGIAYTLNKQILLYFPYKIFKDDDKYQLFGEISYYIYLYDHYGIGNESNIEDNEKYDVTYPRIHTSFLRRFGDFYLGIKTKYDNYSISDLDAEGQLIDDPWAKQGGGQIFAFGPLIQFDTKDYQFHPTKGWLIELGSVTANKSFLSDASYTRMQLDASNYMSIKDDHIIATNLYAGHIFGDPPFSELFYAGSNNRARGLGDRRFKDKSFLAFQAEYRFPLWKRFDGVVFGASSVLASKPSELFNNKYRFTGGLGIRLVVNKKDRVRLRLDYAFSEEGGNMYFTANNAF